MRQDQDFYPTPREAFVPLIPYLPNIPIWEPACGDGRVITWLNEAGFAATGTDLSLGVNYLTDTTYRSCVLTNPPFSLAFEFCKHARRFSQVTFLLLRLNFLASQKRRPWFMANEPDALFVLAERPSFVNNRTDMTDYAWYGWGCHHKGIIHL